MIILHILLIHKLSMKVANTTVICDIINYITIVRGKEL